MSNIFSIFALLISISALYFTIKVFLLKSGQKFRCSFSIASSIDSESSFFNDIIIENLKDRAAIIYKIYIKLGQNIYLLIEDFSEAPLLLKPFEVYYKKYDPILFYSLGAELANIDKSINDKNVKRRIILTTSNGKYSVKPNSKQWDPIIPFFKNHFTAIISPVRLEFRGINYGNNVKFLVAVTNDNGYEYVIPVYNNDYKYTRFSNFKLSKENLETKENLAIFLNGQKTKGNFDFKKIEIIDFKDEIQKLIKDYPREIREVEPLNFFKYRISGKFLTLVDKYKMYKCNQKIKKSKLHK